jgi:DNA-binding MarR family transcriptional regulator
LAKGEVSRQELIKVLGHQKWLTDLLTQAFEKVGLITSRFVKAGRGRPKKIFTLTEKGRLVAANLKEETINELWRVAVGQDFSSPDFSQYKNSSKTSLKVVVGQNFAGPKKYQQDLINLTKNDDLQVYSAGGGAQIRVVAPEAEGPKPPENSPKVSEKPKEATHPPKDEVSKAEEILRRLREGKPKRGGGISSLGEILGFD